MEQTTANLPQRSQRRAVEVSCLTALRASLTIACAIGLSSVSPAQTLSGQQDAPPQQAAYLELPDAPRAVAAGGQVLTAPGTAFTSHSDEDSTLRGLPFRFLKDEANIFTSPARVKKDDLKWLLPLAGASAAAFATDTHTMRDVVSHTASVNDAAITSSDVLRGVAIGVPVLLFGAGQFSGNEHSRESGLLGGEAMVDAYVFSEVVKYATLRERPNLNNARGHFYVGDAVSDPSFVSGHSIVAWSSAAVLAAEYPKPWQQGAIYTLATGVSMTRVLGQQHFPSDVLLGSAAGWLIGHYVYRAHHRHLAK